MSGMEIDLDQIGPNELVQLVDAVSEDDLRESIRAVGTESVLDRIFGELPQWLRADAAPEQADIQFVLLDGDEEHPYGLRIIDHRAEAGRQQLDQPKVTLRTDVPTFIKLITGRAEGPALFMAGRLRVDGDVMFAARIMSFFDRPGA